MNVKIKLNNAEEFRRLLERAAILSDQLNETLQQINEFEISLDVKLN